MSSSFPSPSCWSDVFHSRLCQAQLRFCHRSLTSDPSDPVWVARTASGLSLVKSRSWAAGIPSATRGTEGFDVWMVDETWYNMMKYDEKFCFLAFTSSKEFYREFIQKHTLWHFDCKPLQDFSFEGQEQRLNVLQTSFGVKLTPRVA